MDYHNDEEFRQYYESMMGGSPTESFPPPAYNHVSPEEVAASSGDYFYDGLGHEVSYEEDEGEMATSDWCSAAAANANAARGGKTKKRKQKRDPNKPKGWLSAVLMYSNAHRARVKVENPNASFGDIGRLLSAEYKNLSPEDSAFWQKAAADDKARYNLQMTTYVPPEEFIGRDDTPHSPNHKMKKDPNAPKNKRSAWQYFSSGEARKQVQAQHPGTSVKEVMGILSAQWKTLSEQERASFVEMADIDKARYEREMAIYKAGGRIE